MIDVGRQVVVVLHRSLLVVECGDFTVKPRLAIPSAVIHSAVTHGV